MQQSMAIVGIINQKGGAGKSTIAVHLAHSLALNGDSVLLVDADAQQSSSKWLSRLNYGINAQIINDPDELLDELPQLSNTHDWIIVDGPAALSEITRAVVLVADLAIIPCQPTGVDLESASDTVRLISQAQRIRDGDPKAVIFVNRAVKGTRLKSEALEVLHLMKNITVLKSVLHQRQVIADCFGQNATVFSLPGSAANLSKLEFEGIFAEALGVIYAN